MLHAGHPAPQFHVPSSVNPNFSFDTVAGRYIVLSFFGSSKHPVAERFLTEIVNRDEPFDVTNAVFFGVSIDPADRDRIKHQAPGIIYFWDTDLAVSRLYGLVEDAKSSDASDAQMEYTACTYILDQAMRVIAVFSLSDDPIGHVDTIHEYLRDLPKLNTLTLEAPVLIVPYVFEPELCQTLIDYYETRGGEDSGYMNDVDGKTVAIIDYSHKRRMDCEIIDKDLIRTAHRRILDRLIPAIHRAYQFKVTRIERHIVACYDSAQGAHFKAHRDNTTLGTAHRRFAVTMNLNSPDYEGSEIWFPEFGPKRYKAPSGAAIVFSCSLLHEVPKVTKGRRYAFLPFLYDDAAAAIRQGNHKHVAQQAATGGKVADCNAVPGTPAFSDRKVPVLDGTCGCGNPNGCKTCLTAATYQIGESSDRSKLS